MNSLITTISDEGTTDGGIQLTLFDYLHPHLEPNGGYVSIKADGHCGFRAIARGLFATLGEEGWGLVRCRMGDQFRTHLQHYMRIKDINSLSNMENCQTFYSLLRRTDFPEQAPIPQDYWFQGDLSFQLAADAYDVAIILYTSFRNPVIFCPDPNISIPFTGTLPDIDTSNRAGVVQHLCTLVRTQAVRIIGVYHRGSHFDAMVFKDTPDFRAAIADAIVRGTDLRDPRDSRDRGLVLDLTRFERVPMGEVADNVNLPNSIKHLDYAASDTTVDNWKHQWDQSLSKVAMGSMHGNIDRNAIGTPSRR